MALVEVEKVFRIRPLKGVIRLGIEIFHCSVTRDLWERARRRPAALISSLLSARTLMKWLGPRGRIGKM
jgi:hypothetical protein